MLGEVNQDRIALRKGVNQGIISLDSVGTYFADMMRDKIIPYWYGTPWDFNGYTDEPRRGQVACGYFISTPLKHAGVRVNRYKLAQQAASNIIKSTGKGAKVKTFTSIPEFTDYLNTLPPEGLWVLGLSNHVTFVSREKGKNFIIQSGYYYPVSVTKKQLRFTEELKVSDIFVLGELSRNKGFLKAWLNGERMQVVGG